MTFPTYPSYRDSGVEWFGSLPSHWTILPLKWLLVGNDGGVWGDDPDGEDDTLVLRSTEQTVDGQWQIDDPAARKLSAADRNKALLRAGDLLVTKSSGSALHIGKTTLVAAEVAELHACYSNFMQRLRPSERIFPRLAWYILNSQIARKQLDLMSNSTTGLANLNGTMLGLLETPLPPLPEQTAIAAFLDRETAKIDALVEEQRRLIELLKEKRQAVISHAVTKGLDPTVPMKDSGVEWLGQVPAHWEVNRLDRLMTFASGKAHEPFLDDDGEHVYISARFVSTQGESSKLCTQNLTPAKRGDVVMVMSDLPNGRALARAYQIPDDTSYAVNQRVCRLNEFQGSARYFYYQLDRNPGLLRYDDGVNQTHLSNSAYCKLLLCAPPKREQDEIAQFLDGVTDRLDALQDAAKVAVGVLQERRGALISAAVTGKIDVREVAISRAAAA